MTSMEITTTWREAGFVALSATLMYLAIVAAVRLNGLRSFSKMSSFDFATTVAIGSLLATVSMSGSSLVNGVLAVAVLLGLQAVVAFGRTSGPIDRVVDNQPVLLMAEGRLLDDNLRRARMTPSCSSPPPSDHEERRGGTQRSPPDQRRKPRSAMRERYRSTSMSRR